MGGFGGSVGGEGGGGEGGGEGGGGCAGGEKGGGLGGADGGWWTTVTATGSVSHVRPRSAFVALSAVLCRLRRVELLPEAILEEFDQHMRYSSGGW